MSSHLESFVSSPVPPVMKEFGLEVHGVLLLGVSMPESVEGSSSVLSVGFCCSLKYDVKPIVANGPKELQKFEQ
jgi:hypothetical protein